MRHLSSEHLRTFVAILEAGSVTGGAARIRRSQSAASLQIRQLEAVVGTPVFHRHGRGVTLTAAGESLRPVAHRVLRTLDTTLSELRGDALTGRLRIGMPDDHSRSQLAGIIAEFAARHPDVDLEVHCALGTGFGAALDAGTLDLAVHEVPLPGDGDEVLRRSELRWMCSRHHDPPRTGVLPVAVFDSDCWWRDVALSGLEEAGLNYRVVFSGESTVSVRAAVEAGIAIGLLSALEDPGGLRPVPDLPLRHPSHLVLQRSAPARGPACDAMCDAIRRSFSA